MEEEVSSHYDSTTIALHWLTAGMVAALWCVGRVADFFPKGVWRTNVWSIHVSLGFAFVTVLAWRIVWRFFGRRRLPFPYPGLTHKLAAASHALLYALVCVVVALGVVNAFVRGFNLFDVFALPQFGDRELKTPITFWHGLFANLLMLTALAHACAALFHHYVLQDGVMERMIPERQIYVEEPDLDTLIEDGKGGRSSHT
ncbi:cytochrome b [Methylocella sp.]|uniref:cytochrome b n=1 Tax=Methylocella sp. TaxID=1978226 RepID=UPI0035AE8DBC